MSGDGDAAADLTSPPDPAAQLLESLAMRGPQPIDRLLRSCAAPLDEVLRLLERLREFRMVEMAESPGVEPEFRITPLGTRVASAAATGNIRRHTDALLGPTDDVPGERPPALDPDIGDVEPPAPALHLVVEEAILPVPQPGFRPDFPGLDGPDDPAGGDAPGRGEGGRRPHPERSGTPAPRPADDASPEPGH